MVQLSSISLSSDMFSQVLMMGPSVSGGRVVCPCVAWVCSKHGSSPHKSCLGLEWSHVRHIGVKGSGRRLPVQIMVI